MQALSCERTTCFLDLLSHLLVFNGEDGVDSSEAGYKSSYPVPVFLDADEVQARAAAGVQDQEGSREDVPILLGA